MEKLTSILVVVQDVRKAAPLIDKAVTLATAFRARVEVLVDDSATAQVVTAHCAARSYPDVVLHSAAPSMDSPHQVILQRIWSAHPDLVIKAPAAHDWLLAEESPAPILLARDNPWETPLRFAAAVDVTDEDHASLARSLLHSAGFLALGIEGHLDILYSEPEPDDETVRMKRAVRLAQIVREYHVGCERLQIFSGEPAKRLPPLIAARRYDVLVLGVKPGHAPARALSDATQGDVLLVAASSRSAAEEPWAVSARYQRADQAQELA